MVRIRLRRMGKKHQPSYRIIVVDRRKDGLGNYVENIGFYNNIVNPKVLKIDKERALYWLSKGAQPTDTVRSLLQKEGVIPGGSPAKSKKAKPRLSKKAKAKKAKAAVAEVKTEEKIEAKVAPTKTEEKSTPEKIEKKATPLKSEEKAEQKTALAQDEKKTEEKVEKKSEVKPKVKTEKKSPEKAEAVKPEAKNAKKVS